MTLFLIVQAATAGGLSFAYHDRTTLNTLPAAESFSTTEASPADVVESLLTASGSPIVALGGVVVVERARTDVTFAPAPDAEACVAASIDWFAAVDAAYDAEKWGKAMKLRDRPEPFFGARGVSPECKPVVATVNPDIQGHGVVVEAGALSRMFVWAWRVLGEGTTHVHVQAEPLVETGSGTLSPAPQRLVEFALHDALDAGAERDVVRDILKFVSTIPADPTDPPAISCPIAPLPQGLALTAPPPMASSGPLSAVGAKLDGLPGVAWVGGEEPVFMPAIASTTGNVTDVVARDAGWGVVVASAKGAELVSLPEAQTVSLVTTGGRLIAATAAGAKRVVGVDGEVFKLVERRKEDVDLALPVFDAMADLGRVQTLAADLLVDAGDGGVVTVGVANLDRAGAIGPGELWAEYVSPAGEVRVVDLGASGGLRPIAATARGTLVGVLLGDETGGWSAVAGDIADPTVHAHALLPEGALAHDVVMVEDRLVIAGEADGVAAAWTLQVGRAADNAVRVHHLHAGTRYEAVTAAEDGTLALLVATRNGGFGVARVDAAGACATSR